MHGGGVTQWIEFVSNASLLTPELNRKLVSAGLDRIRISIEGIGEEQYYEMSGVKIDWNKFVANIKDLYEHKGNCEIYIKTVDAAVETPEKKELFYNIFEGICDRIWIDQVVPLWSDYEKINQNFDIKKVGIHGQGMQVVHVCPYPFYNLIVNPDGEVTACCADWRRKLVLGDLKKQSFSEIWNGEILKRFWVDMLKGNKNTYEMCAKCVLPMYDCNDNIDEFAQQILERLEK